jgi:hypothetical protein
MNSVKTIHDNLCKGLRACGIPKEQSYQILNTVKKWYAESGPEWTNSRIKDLRQWYETCLTGNPVPPKWFKHTKEGYPLGIWNWVFNLPTQKALAVLSLNTVFYEQKLSAKQKEKFLHGLEGNGTQNPDLLRKMMIAKAKVRLPKEVVKIKFPTVFDMNGSIPIHNGQSTVRPGENLGLALNALRSSWESVPQVTFDFLVRQDLLGYMPMSVVGNAYTLELERPHDRCVGRVSVLQQPQLKARIVGNPNRVLQVTLEPLKDLYMSTLKKLPTDVTHNQETGVAWVQAKLKQGIELAGSDMISASDLLDVRLCLELVDYTFGFPEVTGYEDYREYFYEVSRAMWYCPALNCEVQWKQGDVLGTGPSFGLLSLTNNAAAIQAYACAVEAGLIDQTKTPIADCFRVVGDDIIMRSEMSSFYTQIIESLGGEINLSKTLTSDRVAEFAGKVITRDASYLKAIKYSEPSDNSFLSYMSQLGDQAKHFLRPKQRKVYELLREVPGILVPGPWSTDSYGIPLSDRYQWYLEEVEPALLAAQPDLLLTDYQLVMLKASLSVAEASSGEDFVETISFDEPVFDEGYLPSQVTPTFKVGGDPRLTDGKTLVDVIYPHVLAKDITPFEDWIKRQKQTTSSQEEFVDDLSSWVNTQVNDLEIVPEVVQEKPKATFDNLLNQATEVGNLSRFTSLVDRLRFVGSIRQPRNIADNDIETEIDDRDERER